MYIYIERENELSPHHTRYASAVQRISDMSAAPLSISTDYLCTMHLDIDIDMHL